MYKSDWFFNLAQVRGSFRLAPGAWISTQCRTNALR
jgi:hypothetical protein